MHLLGAALVELPQQVQPCRGVVADPGHLRSGVRRARPRAHMPNDVSRVPRVRYPPTGPLGTAPLAG